MKDYYGNDFWTEEQGIGIIEIILILAITRILSLFCSIARTDSFSNKSSKSPEPFLLFWINNEVTKIVNKFVLLINAGLTIRGVFERLVQEYRRNKKKSKEKRSGSTLRKKLYSAWKPELDITAISSVSTPSFE